MKGPQERAGAEVYGWGPPLSHIPPSPGRQTASLGPSFPLPQPEFPSSPAPQPELCHQDEQDSAASSALA